MFARILVSLDGSEDARAAGTLALRLGARLGSRVAGLSVVDARVVEGPAVETLAPLWGEVSARPFQPEVLRVFRERADAILGDFCAEAERDGCACVERYVEVGVADDVILDRSQTSDLLALGRRGEHAVFGRGPVGSTAWRVLHDCSVPVLLNGRSGPEVPQTSLVAWDGNAASTRALELALAYTDAVGGRLRIVHAGDEAADATLDSAHGLLRGHNIEWESARIDADPAAAVAEALARWNAQAVFMGAFGRGRVRGFLFGSHTARILQHVDVPLFVTR